VASNSNYWFTPSHDHLPIQKRAATSAVRRNGKLIVSRKKNDTNGHSCTANPRANCIRSNHCCRQLRLWSNKDSCELGVQKLPRIQKKIANWRVAIW
jgi:hypothetical protein